MEKQLLKIYKNFKEANDKIIKEGKSILPFCFMIDENNKIEIIILRFSNAYEKEKEKDILLKYLATNKIKGYILILDTKMTLIDLKTNKNVVNDVVVRSLYTSKETIREFVVYEKKKIIKKLDINGMNMKYDEWGLWDKKYDENNEEDKKIVENYQKFKDENKEKYKGICN